jgi:hypothetical protein
MSVPPQNLFAVRSGVGLKGEETRDEAVETYGGKGE